MTNLRFLLFLSLVTLENFQVENKYVLKLAASSEKNQLLIMLAWIKIKFTLKIKTKFATHSEVKLKRLSCNKALTSVEL